MDGSRPITHVNTMWVPFKYYTFVHICHSYTASMSTCCETYTHYCPTHNRSTPLTQRRMVGLKLYKELFIFLQARMEPHRIMNSYHWNEKSRFFEWTAKQHLWTCRFRSFASFFCFFFLLLSFWSTAASTRWCATAEPAVCWFVTTSCVQCYGSKIMATRRWKSFCLYSHNSASCSER